MITLTGTVTFETRLGQTFTITPGDILLAEDHTGGGHRWRLLGDQPWRRVYVDMDEDTMRRIAEATGGKYFHARNVDGLREVYAEIDRLERTDVTEVRYLQYREHFPGLVEAGIGLIALAALASATVLRRLP